ncbi:hypothetical protein PR202_gb27985 [Eleusine coracana subsp. coracana]|uniref:Neprosin PEP catalytic domain-containing protein n=1 Tax=Eleusine coracana subsp. coracana TaxID=191504 RepID=A0AAV5FTE1_ELECO|nr:hypothetical protein PR202_gb27985 [Eleusine coracana subsp. coracana]
MQVTLLCLAPSRPPLSTLRQRPLPSVVTLASAQRASAPCRVAAFGGTTFYAAAARSSLLRLAALAEESPASGPSDHTPLSVENETERARIAQLFGRLELRLPPGRRRGNPSRIALPVAIPLRHVRQSTHCRLTLRRSRAYSPQVVSSSTANQACLLPSQTLVMPFALRQSIFASILVINQQGRNGDINAMHAGWAIDPSFYGDSKTHFSADGYKSTGCTDVRCDGFKPANNAPINPGNSLEGKRSEVGEPNPPMGNGHWPGKNSASFQNVQFVDKHGNGYAPPPWPAGVHSDVSHNKCYQIDVPEHSTEDSDNVVVLSTEDEIIRRVPNAPGKGKSHVWPHIGGEMAG